MPAFAALYWAAKIACLIAWTASSYLMTSLMPHHSPNHRLGAIAVITDITDTPRAPYFTFAITSENFA